MTGPWSNPGPGHRRSLPIIDDETSHSTPNLLFYMYFTGRCTDRVLTRIIYNLLIYLPTPSVGNSNKSLGSSFFVL